MIELILSTTLTGLILIVFIARMHPDLATEVLRDRLYCIRNTLFDDMMRSGYPLDHRLHESMRKRINGLIWISGRLNIFVAIALVRRFPQVQGASSLDQDLPENVRSALERARQGVDETLTRYLFRESFAGLVLHTFWIAGRGFGTIAPTVRDTLDARLRATLRAIDRWAVKFSSCEEKLAPWDEPDTKRPTLSPLFPTANATIPIAHSN